MADSADDEVRPMLAYAASDNRTAAPYFGYGMVGPVKYIDMFTPSSNSPTTTSLTSKKTEGAEGCWAHRPGETIVPT